MRKVLTAEEMREVDRQTSEKYGIPSILLMENAAHAAARVITGKLGGSMLRRYFVVLCGKGNNGGDGAALARILWSQGANVSVYLFGFNVAETKGDARINFEALKKISETGQAKSIDSNFLHLSENTNSEYFDPWLITEECVIDALFGTGLVKPLEGDIEKIISGFSKNKKELTLSTLVSIDLPSGLNADFGEPIGESFPADLTITFTAPKLANVLPPASKNFNGELHIANIGSPQELIDNSPSKIFLAEKSDARNWLEKSRYKSNSYKNKRGHALLIAGSKEYAGAAVLAGNAAMLSGVGLTTIATSESAQATIQAKVLEEIITRGLSETRSGAISSKAFETVEKLFEKIDAVGIGCGLSFGEKATKDFVREVVTKRKTPVVIDADALNALSPFDLKGSDELPLILTPHEGEFLRLLETTDKAILKDRVKAARDFVEKHRVILVLKGERVLIAAPDGTVVINPTGNSGLGKAGNGDTLTGIITGFVAQAVQMKIDIFETVVAAVYIAGAAGDIAAEKYGKRSMLASDVRECLGAAFELINNE